MGDTFVIRTVNNGEPHYTDAGNDFASAVRQLDTFAWYFAPTVLKVVEIHQHEWDAVQATERPNALRVASYNPPWLASDQP